MIWIKREKLVATVADYYLDTIAQGLEKAGYPVRAAYEWEEMDIRPGDQALIIAATRAYHLWKKKIPYLYWAQGVWPEESYLRYHSPLRFRVQSHLEKRALKKAEFVFFVSESMKNHFEAKYKLHFHGKCYIMPCANEQFHPEAFDAPGKYESNVFCYAGALSRWQCFEETVALYKKIERARPDSRLLLLVKERQQALAMLEKYDVKNYSIDYVPVEKLPEVLRQAKFGFVLRQESPVNAVATPTKVVTYLCNGLIPIYSHTLTGIREILKDARYPIVYENNGDISRILEAMDGPMNPEEVRSDLEAIYETTYQRSQHIDRIGRRYQAAVRK